MVRLSDCERRAERAHWGSGGWGLFPENTEKREQVSGESLLSRLLSVVTSRVMHNKVGMNLK